MSKTGLMRLSGFSLMLGGVALFLHYLTHPQGESAQFVAMPLWIPSHLLQFVAWLLILIGLVGLYLRQAEKVGVIGLVTFVLVFGTGMISAGGGFWVGGVFQVLYPHAGDPGGVFFSSAGARFAFELDQSWIFAFLFFAVVSLRAGVLPRVGAWLIILTVILAVGALTVFPTGSAAEYQIGVVASAIFGLGLVVWGYALSSSGKKLALRAVPEPS